MAVTTSGNREANGGWRPTYPVGSSAVFVWPLQPRAALKTLFGFPGYFWPVNSFWLGITLVTWFFLTPDLAVMKHFEVWWIAIIFGRNLALMIFVCGGLHYYLYVLKVQNEDYRFNTSPLPTDNPRFLFRRQVHDNMFWCLTSGVATWTAYEVFTYWAFANGFMGLANWITDPAWFWGWFILLLALSPIIHHVHFYFTHRLLHWRPLYRTVHHVHHRNINIGPWSGLSMHPVEQVIFLSDVVIQWMIALHPINALFQLQLAALNPALGHCGFDRIILGDQKALTLGNYFHYLHHKFFECNYGGSLVPLDKWFGTLHDGSDAGYVKFRERLRNRAGVMK